MLFSLQLQKKRSNGWQLYQNGIEVFTVSLFHILRVKQPNGGFHKSVVRGKPK